MTQYATPCSSSNVNVLSCSQVGLRNSAPRRPPAAVSAASHGPLPDSDQGSLPPQPRPRHLSTRGPRPPLLHGPARERDLERVALGPVAYRAFDTFDEVIEQANRLPYGLAAFAFTENGRRANLIGDLVESGMVGINTFALSTADAPFGGVKDSGFGSEGGKEGLESYQVVKAIHQA